MRLRLTTYSCRGVFFFEMRSFSKVWNSGKAGGLLIVFICGSGCAALRARTAGLGEEGSEVWY